MAITPVIPPTHKTVQKKKHLGEKQQSFLSLLRVAGKINSQTESFPMK